MPVTELSINILLIILGAIIGGILRPLFEDVYTTHVKPRFFAKEGALSDNELKEETEKLVEEIYRFLRIRQRNSPPWPHVEGDQEEVREAHSEKMNYERESGTLFLEQFGAQIQELIEEYDRRGFDTDKLEWELKGSSTTGSIIINQIAHELLSMAQSVSNEEK